MRTKTYLISGILIALLIGVSIEIQSKILWAVGFALLLTTTIIYMVKNYTILGVDEK